MSDRTVEAGLWMKLPPQVQMDAMRVALTWPGRLRLPVSYVAGARPLENFKTAPGFAKRVYREIDSYAVKPTAAQSHPDRELYVLAGVLGDEDRFSDPASIEQMFMGWTREDEERSRRMRRERLDEEEKEWSSLIRDDYPKPNALVKKLTPLMRPHLPLYQRLCRALPKGGATFGSYVKMLRLLAERGILVEHWDHGEKRGTPRAVVQLQPYLAKFKLGLQMRTEALMRTFDVWGCGVGPMGLDRPDAEFYSERALLRTSTDDARTKTTAYKALQARVRTHIGHILAQVPKKPIVNVRAEKRAARGKMRNVARRDKANLHLAETEVLDGQHHHSAAGGDAQRYVVEKNPGPKAVSVICGCAAWFMLLLTILFRIMLLACTVAATLWVYVLIHPWSCAFRYALHLLGLGRSHCITHAEHILLAVPAYIVPAHFMSGTHARLVPALLFGAYEMSTYATVATWRNEDRWAVLRHSYMPLGHALIAHVAMTQGLDAALAAHLLINFFLTLYGMANLGKKKRATKVKKTREEARAERAAEKAMAVAEAAPSATAAIAALEAEGDAGGEPAKPEPEPTYADHDVTGPRTETRTFITRMHINQCLPARIMKHPSVQAAIRARDGKCVLPVCSLYAIGHLIDSCLDSIYWAYMSSVASSILLDISMTAVGAQFPVIAALQAWMVAAQARNTDRAADMVRAVWASRHNWFHAQGRTVNSTDKVYDHIDNAGLYPQDYLNMEEGFKIFRVDSTSQAADPNEEDKRDPSLRSFKRTTPQVQTQVDVTVYTIYPMRGTMSADFSNVGDTDELLVCRSLTGRTGDLPHVVNVAKAMFSKVPDHNRDYQRPGSEIAAEWLIRATLQSRICENDHLFDCLNWFGDVQDVGNDRAGVISRV